jgi:hypothetical protein
MNEIIKSYGHNAGRVWEILNSQGPQVQTKLMKLANLREDEFFGGVGWLARENKIARDKRTYKLSETNLTDIIGRDAGKVWEILGKNTDIDVSAISRLANITKSDCYAALGWLACEGKITAKVKVKRKE